MKNVPTLLLLVAMLLPHGASAINYDDDDDDDERPAKSYVTAVPRTPAERYKARMESFNAQIEGRREDCKRREGISKDLCRKEVDQAELQGRHSVETQLKEEQAKEAAAKPATP